MRKAAIIRPTPRDRRSCRQSCLRDPSAGRQARERSTWREAGAQLPPVMARESIMSKLPSTLCTSAASCSIQAAEIPVVRSEKVSPAASRLPTSDGYVFATCWSLRCKPETRCSSLNDPEPRIFKASHRRRLPRGAVPVDSRRRRRRARWLLQQASTSEKTKRSGVQDPRVRPKPAEKQKEATSNTTHQTSIWLPCTECLQKSAELSRVALKTACALVLTPIKPKTCTSTSTCSWQL